MWQKATVIGLSVALGAIGAWAGGSGESPGRPFQPHGGASAPGAVAELRTAVGRVAVARGDDPAAPAGVGGLPMPAAPGGAAPADDPAAAGSRGACELLADPDAAATLPPRLVDELQLGRLGVAARLALTSTRAASERVASGDAELAIVARGAYGPSTRTTAGERLLGAWLPVLVAHPDNPLHNVPSRKLRDLLRGQLRSWRELGGPDLPIELVVPADADARAMIGRALIPGDRLDERARTASREEDCLAITLAERGAVTVVSLALTEFHAVRPLTIDGIAPSAAARNRGTYPFGVDVLLLEARAKGAAARRLIALFESEDGRRRLAERLSLP
ncbi:MAG: hypothetical protein IPM29_31455 [Planctomycetes bacterium]|nr:hypothetical protein [Planctomycetota bacterium]